jgi:hypothetical protein
MEERARTLRRAFRYLKRGVFPPESIDEFTFGRAAELATVECHLDDAREGLTRHIFVEAPYGQGKSHMLKAIEAIALRKGFGVSWVTLDGYSHACNHPTRYLHSFLENLRVPNSPIRGLASLVKSWLGGEKSEPVASWIRQAAPWWFRYHMEKFQRSLDVTQDVPLLCSWIESRDIAHRNGKPWFDLADQRMQATGALLRAAGFSGVVYLFDELETVATLLSSIRQRFLSYEFLNILIDGRKHPHCFVAFAATPDFGFKVELDRLELDRPYVGFRADYPEGCRFINKWHASSIDLAKLRPLSKTDLTRLCIRLRGFHEEAFAWSMNGKFSDDFLEVFVAATVDRNMGIRETIKAIVNLFELAEQHPSADLEGALELSEAPSH